MKYTSIFRESPRKQREYKDGGIVGEPQPDIFETRESYNEEDLIPPETKFTYQQSRWKPIVDRVTGVLQWGLNMFKAAIKFLDSFWAGLLFMVGFNSIFIPDWSILHTTLLNFVMFAGITALNKILNK